METKDKQLEFIVNGEMVKIQSITQEELNKKLIKEEQSGNDIETIDHDWLWYFMCVDKAISKYVGKKVAAFPKGNSRIAFAAYCRGGYCGNYTVYSDCINYPAFEMQGYINAKKSAAKAKKA